MTVNLFRVLEIVKVLLALPKPREALILCVSVHWTDTELSTCNCPCTVMLVRVRFEPVRNGVVLSLQVIEK